MENEVLDLDLSLLEWLYPRLLYFKNFCDYGMGTPYGISRCDWEEIIDELIMHIGNVFEFNEDYYSSNRIAFRMIGEYGTKLWI